MRRIFLLILLLAPVAVLAATPQLRVLAGFEAGVWQATPLGGGEGSSRCIADAVPLLTGDRAAAQCSFTLIEDGADVGVVTYRCGSGRSGRTALRRDTAGLYTIDAQGLEGALPFASRMEWRRTGSC